MGGETWGGGQRDKREEAQAEAGGGMTGVPLQGPRADFFLPILRRSPPLDWIGLPPGAFRIVFSDFFSEEEAGAWFVHCFHRAF